MPGSYYLPGKKMVDKMSTIHSDHHSHPPVSEGSREVANLTEIKNPNRWYMVSKNLSVCLSVVNFDPNYTTAGSETLF